MSSSQYRFPEDRYILLGTVAKAQGLAGEVSIHVFTGKGENLRHYPAFTLVDDRGELSPELRVVSFRVQKNRAIIGFAQVVDRTFAERLAGMGVLVNRDDLPELAEDEFYWHAVYGLPVRTRQGRKLGTVLALFSNGAQDVMVIGDGDSEYLVPMSPGTVTGIERSEIIIDPPPGLLSINDEE
ncbi:MAG: ribosome maturation factor RimM [Desulfopila sp.]